MPRAQSRTPLPAPTFQTRPSLPSCSPPSHEPDSTFSSGGGTVNGFAYTSRSPESQSSSALWQSDAGARRPRRSRAVLDCAPRPTRRPVPRARRRTRRPCASSALRRAWRSAPNAAAGSPFRAQATCRTTRSTASFEHRLVAAMTEPHEHVRLGQGRFAQALARGRARLATRTSTPRSSGKDRRNGPVDAVRVDIRPARCVRTTPRPPAASPERPRQAIEQPTTPPAWRIT